MKTLRIGLLLSMAFVCAAVAGPGARPPKVEFSRNGVTVGDLKPGTHVAWMAMLREPGKRRTTVRILRGYGPATPDATFAVEHARADETRGLWTVIDVETGAAVHAKSPVTVASSRPIAVRAAAGQTSVAISSAAVELLYVRPRWGAWAISVADGGGLDSDGQQNGIVVMPLRSLTRFRGNPHPPETIEAGDVILVIDPRRFRTAAVEVQP